MLVSWLTGRMHPAASRAVLGDYRSAVVEWGVLEEYVFYQTHVDERVNHVARLLVVVERHRALPYYQCAGLRFRRTRACVDHGHHFRMRVFVLFFVAEKPFEYFPFPLRTYVYEEPLYLFLEQDDKHYEAYVQ